MALVEWSTIWQAELWQPCINVIKRKPVTHFVGENFF